MSDVLDPEDAKLVTLARGARGRIGAAQGAAIRDEMGRTYSGATVARGALSLSALELAVAQAVAAGARGVECAVVFGGEDMSVDAVRELGGAGVPVLLVDAGGTVRERVTT